MVQDPPQDWYGREPTYEPEAARVPAPGATVQDPAKPGAERPGAERPGAVDPGAGIRGAANPVTVNPVVVNPVVTDPVVPDPVVPDPAVPGRSAANPVRAEPVPADPVPADPGSAHRAMADPPVVDLPPEPVTQVLPGPVPAFDPEPDDRTVLLRKTEPAPEPPVPTGGRAERRKAAKGRGRKAAVPAEPVIPAIPRTRMEARAAARALKDSPAVIASRAIGEIFISLGVLMLLFVTYQLWWTNVRAHQEANGTAHSLQDDWAKGGDKKSGPGAFEPGQGFAIIHIPELDVVVPIAEGVSKTKVLDRGMVGHYSEGELKTAMPSAKTGNFALAGHRNTHGEPFRYINKLKDGDKVVVETQDDYYTYEVTSHLAQTSPSNVSVIEPVPVGSGFTKPGRYITLTTCTPEFTSTYRMVVWGKMVDERPRSKGLPDALTTG
ncbi:class E sortase [Streptomyces sp. NBC_01387]|uniref:class E sortase n=1 Tax=Streptomyces sp. NBC_01387 TaxID=2903849 RepID=UPI0038693AC0